MRTARTYKEKWIRSLNKTIKSLEESYSMLINTKWNTDELHLISEQMRYIAKKQNILRKLRSKVNKEEAKNLPPKRFPTELQISLKIALPKIYDKIYEKRKEKIRSQKENCSFIDGK